jgi:hypothetical protein
MKLLDHAIDNRIRAVLTKTLELVMDLQYRRWAKNLLAGGQHDQSETARIVMNCDKYQVAYPVISAIATHFTAQMWSGWDDVCEELCWERDNWLQQAEQTLLQGV